MSLVVGMATFQERALLASESPGYPLVDATVRHRTAGGGAALEVRYELLKLPRGALVATFNPLFIVGDGGIAWLVPLGVAYRFQ